MRFADFIIPEAIQAPLTATDEAEAIRVLVGAMQAQGACAAEAVDGVVQAVWARESLGTTGLGHEAALPHAKHPAVQRCSGTVGISREGLDFHSVDKQRVHLIFLVVSPPTAAADHVSALEWIARHLRNETFRRLLRDARSAAGVQELLHRADDGQFV